MTDPAETTASWGDRKLFAVFDPQTPGDEGVPAVEPGEVPTADTGDYLFGRITPVLAALFPESPARRGETKAELKTAGYYQPHAWQNLAAVRYLAIMLPLLAVGTLLVLLPTRWEPVLLMLLVLLPLLGWAVPRLYLRRRAADRVRRIEHAMPDMLDMLNMCVSQGLTVPESLRQISRELRPVHPDLATELSIVSEQADLGTFRQALENFGRRIDSPEIHSFTSLLIQTERMGTSVSQALIEYSDSLRETQRQRADEKANRAAFQLLFPTALCLMPAVYLILLGPAVVELSDFFYGGRRDGLDRQQQAIERFSQPPGERGGQS